MRKVSGPSRPGSLNARDAVESATSARRATSVRVGDMAAFLAATAGGGHRPYQILRKRINACRVLPSPATGHHRTPPDTTAYCYPPRVIYFAVAGR
ncbi:hypothetical protein GCM10010361_74010 [Streptomyces olivaceiscleroticus]|uniref:Uncharacterized protein n=1 Tax=Streptomyces olivaceiscleroticus TaxID=68245 RepID=A0ABN1BIS1_9ACTN